MRLHCGAHFFKKIAGEHPGLFEEELEFIFDSR
jgi:hypothetical protein